MSKEAWPLTLRASSMLLVSARELGDSGRMRPAIRMIMPGTAAQSTPNRYKDV